MSSFKAQMFGKEKGWYFIMLKGSVFRNKGTWQNSKGFNGWWGFNLYLEKDWTRVLVLSIIFLIIKVKIIKYGKRHLKTICLCTPSKATIKMLSLFKIINWYCEYCFGTSFLLLNVSDHLWVPSLHFYWQLYFNKIIWWSREFEPLSILWFV